MAADPGLAQQQEVEALQAIYGEVKLPLGYHRDLTTAHVSPNP
jgi:hypothetical protein